MFDNIVDMARRPAAQEAETRAITQHKIATSHRLAEELCLDLARKHAGCVEWTECDTCKRLTRELRSDWVASGLRSFVPWLMLFDHASPTGAFLRSLAAASVIARSEEIKNAEKKAHAEKREVFLRRCITCERTFATRFHFKRIADLLYCGRYKPLSKAKKKAYAQKRDAFLHCMTNYERLACEDLSAVLGDPNSGPTQMRHAARKLKELREKIDCRSERLERELLVAACSTESFKSRVERMLNKVREFERIDSKKFFEKAIRRYLTAKTRNATWAASLPLLEYLALEWLRDERSLWRFLDASFARWKDFKNPKSVRHRSIVIHQLHGSQASLDECGKQNIKPMGEIVARLLKQSDGSPRDGADKLNGALRTQKSRELSKFQGKQPAIPVTIR